MKRTFYFIIAVLLALPAYVVSQDPQDLPTSPSGNQYYQDQGNPAGETDYYDSFGSINLPIRVYTPPGYDESREYASMYLFHGMGGSEASWHDNDLFSHIQLDNLIAEGRVSDGFVMIYTKQEGDWNSAMVDHLMPFIEENYSVSKDPAHRGVGGLSMGCMATQTLANAHIDKFQYLMPTSCGGSFRFSSTVASYAKDIKLALITCGENEGDMVTGMANSLVSAGVPEDNVYTWLAPGGGHNRDTWRPTFWNFAQMAFDRGFTDFPDEIAPVSSKANTLNFSINQNPYSKTIKISFTLPQTTMITVTIFNIDGTRVRTLASGEKISGQHILEWDCRDNYGKHLSTGVYMLRLTTSGDVVHRKIMLIR